MRAHHLRAILKSTGITFVGGYSAGYAGTVSDITVPLTSLTGGIGTQPIAGDLVVVFYGIGYTSGIQGFSLSGYISGSLTGTDNYNTKSAYGYRLMPATPDTSITITGGTGGIANAGAVALQVWRRVHATTPLDVTTTTATGTNSLLANPPAITPTTAGAIILAGGVGAHVQGVQTFSSSALANFISVGGDDTTDVTVGLGSYVWTSGAYDPAVFTFSGSDITTSSWVAATLALRPA
jgi:hypothetical protein